MLEVIKNIINKNLYTVSLYARQMAGTLVLFVIARYLSVYDFGLFSSYKNIAAFCFMFANLGFAEYILVSSQANVKEVKLKISLFMLNAIVIAFLINICSLFFKLDSHLLFWLVVVRTFFDSTFFALILSYFQAAKKFNQIAIINIIYAVCIAIIAIISFIFKLSLIKFLILNIILGLLNFIQCSFLANINYLIMLCYFKRFLKMLDKTIINYSLVEIACLLYIQIQSIFVSCYLPKEDAALYFSAFTIASVISLFIAAQRQKLVPELIFVKSKDIKSILKKNLFSSCKVISAFAIVFIFGGKYILNFLYGHNYYANAYFVLILFTISTFFTAAIAITGTYFTAINKVYKKTPLQIESIFVAVISLMLLKSYGIYGATISYFLTAIYLAIRYTYSVNKEININIQKENK